MLGIGNSLIKSGGGVRSIVKKGLQAWYKADETQAPLGEEQITNGGFNIGPELLEQPNFNISGTLTTSANPFRWYIVPHQGIADPNFGASINNNQLTISVDGFNRDGGTGRIFGFGDGTNILISGKTYALTYTVVAVNNAAGNFKIFTGNPAYQTVETLGGSTEIGTHTIYFEWDDDESQNTQGRSTLPILLNNGTSNGAFTASITLSNVSLKRTDPNDSWTLDPDGSTSTGDGWNVKDGYIEAIGTGNNDDIKQTILTVGKKYRVTLTASDGMGSGTNFYVGDASFASQDDYAAISTNGTHTHEWTASNTVFVIRRKSNTTVKVSNVSVKEITNSIRDYSPNSNDGTLYSGKALEFDGTGDAVNLGVLDNTAISSSTKLTIAVWFNVDAPADDMIFSTGQNGNNRFYMWSLNNELQLGFGTNLGTTVPSIGTQPTIGADKWYRAVVVVDGLTANVYMDGDFKYSKESVAFTTEDSLYIGQHAESGTPYYFNGKLADFQIYDKAWTPSDVKYDWQNPDKDVFDDENRAQRLGDNLQLNDFTTSISDGTTWGTANCTTEVSNGVITITTDGNEYWGQAYLGSSNGIFEVGSYYIISGALRNIDSVHGVAVEWVDKTDSQTIISNNGIKLTSTDWVNFTSEPVQALEAFPSQLKLNVWNPNDGSTPVNSGQFKDIVVKKVLDHKAEIKPYNCKTLLRLNEGAGDRAYNAAPVLGAEMWDGANGDITNWTPFDNNEVSSDDGAVKIKNIDNSSGVYIYLRDSKDLNDNLVIGETYRLSFSTKVNQGSSVQWRIYDTDGTNYFFDYFDSTDYITQTIIFKATDNDNHYLFPVVNSGEEAWIKDISLKKISLSNSLIHLGDPAWTTTPQPYIPQYAMSSYSKKINFTGIDEKVDLGSTQTIADNEPASISFWYGIGANNSSENYILGTNTGDDYLRIDNQNESLLWRMNGSGVTFDFSDLSENKLSHICITRASGNQPDAKCYVNGILASSFTNSDNPNGSDGPFDYRYIGSYGGTTSMTGFVDEVAVFSKALSQTEVQEIFNSGLAQTLNNISYPDLEGYWRNNGTDQWDDLSTNSNHGTVNGSPTTINLQEVPYFKKDTFGLPMNKVRQRAINYNQDSYLESGSNVNFGTNDFSFECWVQYNYKNIGSVWNVILHNGSMSASNGTGFGLASDTNRFAVRLNGNTAHAYIGASSGLNEGQWYHVAVTRSGTTLKTYLDTVEETHTISAIDVTTTTPLRIGRDTTGARYYTGLIDDVKIYDRALSKKQIYKNYKATKRSHNTTNTKIWSDQLNDNLV